VLQPTKFELVISLKAAKWISVCAQYARTRTRSRRGRSGAERRPRQKASLGLFARPSCRQAIHSLPPRPSAPGLPQWRPPRIWHGLLKAALSEAAARIEDSDVHACVHKPIGRADQEIAALLSSSSLVQRTDLRLWLLTPRTDLPEPFR